MEANKIKEIEVYTEQLWENIGLNIKLQKRAEEIGDKKNAKEFKQYVRLARARWNQANTILKFLKNEEELPKIFKY